MNKTYLELKDQYNAMERSMLFLETKLEEIKHLLGQRSFSGITCLGCGSSFNIAQSLAQIARTQLNMHADAYAAGDLMLHLDRYLPVLKDTLVIAISRSGNTTELMMAVQAIQKSSGNRVLSLTCAEGSRLSVLSDVSVDMPWAFDESVCQTRTVSCFYAVGLALLAHLGEKDSLILEIKEAIKQGPAFFAAYENTLKKIAEIPWTDAVVLADAELEGIAGEGALAFKEICQHPSNYYHLLDARHGPMVMIRPHTLVIAALSEESPYEIGFVEDLMKKGCTAVIYTDIANPGLPSACHQVNFGRKLPHAVRGIPLILICQLLSYYKALTTGTNPDEPDGLDAWIKLQE